MFNSLRFLLGSLKRRLILANRQALWRKQNKHNQTNPVNIFPLEKVKVGRYTYGDLRVYCYRNPQESLRIGDFCSIASDVIFILGGEHNYTVEIFDPLANRWQELPELNIPRAIPFFYLI